MNLARGQRQAPPRHRDARTRAETRAVQRLGTAPGASGAAEAPRRADEG